MVFPVVIYGCESWAIKRAEHWRIDAFELGYWSRFLRVPWNARRSKQSILKEISAGCSLEELMLKLKLPYLATWCEELISWKDPDAGKDWGQEEKGMTEDKMVAWHHRLNGHRFQCPPRFGDGQEGLECYNSWSSKKSDTIERLNQTKLKCLRRINKMPYGYNYLYMH